MEEQEVLTMRRKLITIGLAVGLLAVAGGAVLAQEPDGSDGEAVAEVVEDDQVVAVSIGNANVEMAPQGPDELAVRIAEILGADPQAVSDAMIQVDAAMYAEYVDALLRRHVADGHISEEQANAIRAQVQSGDHTALDRLWTYSYEEAWGGDSSSAEVVAEGASYQDYGDRIGTILGLDGQRVANAIAQAYEELYAVQREIWDNGPGRDKGDKEESEKYPTR